MCTIISRLNVLSVGLVGLGENARGSRSLDILTGTSEALMGSLYKQIGSMEAPRNLEIINDVILHSYRSIRLCYDVINQCRSA